ncbi:hypothetical protein [Oceanidesulfovibrio marinus]|uniref:Uncharacterized protein n=1 Tax=Oceanidesulfovibrio marinus TaxID=370038 RepID=A0ABX6NIC6_9BACT|nr:hypothetical protein [Oceanidesulfovibrio marinus]QJT10318.1 hypothetical protein E8L03_15875 [Oceanidesulfovibrio marinus]
MTTQETIPQESQEKTVLFTDNDGNTLDTLVSPPEAGTMLRGEVLKTAKGENGRSYYEIFEFEDSEDTLVVRCRPITPQYLNAILLPAILIATWFGISYGMKLLHIAG